MHSRATQTNKQTTQANNTQNKQNKQHKTNNTNKQTQTKQTKQTTQTNKQHKHKQTNTNKTNKTTQSKQHKQSQHTNKFEDGIPLCSVLFNLNTKCTVGVIDFDYVVVMFVLLQKNSPLGQKKEAICVKESRCCISHRT